MISKDKLFIVASNLDDSIKAQTIVFDVTLFKTFVDLEKYINSTPCVVNTIVISETDLEFNNVNMSRLITMLSSPFLKLENKFVYLISEQTNKDDVEGFIETNEIDRWKVYQGDLSPRFITAIVTGEGRDTEIPEIEVHTYRMRAKDYVEYKQREQYEDNQRAYYTDEDLLSGIPDVEVPEDVVPSLDFKHKTYYIVGEQSLERTIFSFVLAQYLSLETKTLILESDVEYHTLSDIVTKSGVKCKLVKVEDFYRDCKGTINKIRETTAKLIVVVATERVKFDYDFLLNLIISNTVGFVTNFVKECDFNDTPYGRSYTIVCRNTIPDILKCVSSLRYDVNPLNTVFVGMQINDIGSVNVTSAEMQAVINSLLGKDDLTAQVVKAKGVKLKGDGIIYDVLSLVGRGNEG